MDTAQSVGALAHTPLDEDDSLEQFAHTETTSKLLRAVAEEETKKGIFGTLKVWVRAYTAALIGTFVVLPIVISVATVAIYIASPGPGWQIIGYSIAAMIALWLIIAIPYCYFTTAAGANRSSYGLLTGRLRLLEAQLSMATRNKEEVVGTTATPAAGYSHKAIALEEAYTCYRSVYRLIYGSPTGLEWVMGVGYINAWMMLHHAEEALLEVQPDQLVLRNAIHDKLAIQGSTMSNEAELLEKLVNAANELDPAAAQYFKMSPPDKTNKEIRKLQQKVDQLAHAIKKGDTANTLTAIQDTPSLTSKAEDLAIRAEKQARARVALREVRSTLNDFRDNSWQGLVRARNNLLGAIALMGCVTYVLLCIIILSGGPPSNQLGATVLGATSFYMIGAIAGMFGRFYRESRVNTAVDDYGLSFVRMLAIPLLSGLAGVGGVLITALLYSTLPGQQSTLQDIFQLKYLHFLLVAAVSGLAPSLIIRSLEKSASQYLDGLQSSKGSEQATPDTKA